MFLTSEEKKLLKKGLLVKSVFFAIIVVNLYTHSDTRDQLFVHLGAMLALFLIFFGEIVGRRFFSGK